MTKSKLEAVGTVEDVRCRVGEYEARIVSNDVEHNSISRDRAFLLAQLDEAIEDRIIARAKERDCIREHIESSQDAATALRLLKRARNGFVVHLCIDGVPHGVEQNNSITCLACDINNFFYPNLPIKDSSDLHFTIPCEATQTEVPPIPLTRSPDGLEVGNWKYGYPENNK